VIKGNCKNCDYFDRQNKLLGYCIINPPSAVVLDGEIFSVWPEVSNENVCGKFSERRPESHYGSAQR